MRDTISVSLPTEVRQELDEAAEADGRSRMVVRAREKGIFTDEDVFERIS